ncbi:MAG TPA: M13 family metallopeptidase [Pseudomonadota bacterium]|nr:M13 family metallopeptidase [Pseudomonadota bacterium]
MRRAFVALLSHPVPSKRRGRLPLLAALATVLAGGTTYALATRGGRPAPAAGSLAAGAGLDLIGMDRAVRPGDDFFAYTNGAWRKNTEIPADQGSYGVNAALHELTVRRTADLIMETAKTESPAGSDARKIRDYYTSFLDEAAIEAKGLSPLLPTLERIRAVRSPSELARELGKTLRADVDAVNSTNFYTPNLLGLWVAQDFDDPSRYSPFLMQGGLGMPDRDFYTDPAPRMAELRTAYRTYIGTLLKLAGVADAEARAGRIFELESRIAQVHATRVESEDVIKGNNHWSRADFDRRARGLDWGAFFTAAGLEGQPSFVVWHQSALIGIAALVGKEPLATWKDYLVFHTVSASAGVLPKAFVDANFAFYGKALSGTPQLRDRWKRAVAATDRALGEAVGKLYVARYFPPAEKARAEQMVRNELAAFARRIDRLDWMAPQTKEKAKAKLAALRVGVGYPDSWRDYSELVVVRGDALGNAERAGLFEYRRNLKKLGKPVDRSEWVMNPQLVNAVNLPAMNALNFPAAILQPPLFDPSRPVAMDYGAAGATIGHEISHSFDDQGALFDAKGRLQNWWTKEDLAHFKAAAEKLIRQYDGYRPFPDLAVNGRLTVSENIADLAGLLAAYDAYQLSLGGKPAATVQGLTGSQQFFISFGQSWREKSREPLLRQHIIIDSHAPAEYRADTVRNLDPWYEAFGVAPGQALYLAPADRVRVW